MNVSWNCWPTNRDDRPVYRAKSVRLWQAKMIAHCDDCMLQRKFLREDFNIKILKFHGKYPCFCKYLNFLITQCRNEVALIPCQNISSVHPSLLIAYWLVADTDRHRHCAGKIDLTSSWRDTMPESFSILSPTSTNIYAMTRSACVCKCSQCRVHGHHHCIKSYHSVAHWTTFLLSLFTVPARTENNYYLLCPPYEQWITLFQYLFAVRAHGEYHYAYF